MEKQELIAKAKSHVSKFTPRDASRLSPDDFPRVQVTETAMVSFQSDMRKDRVLVFLDRATGEFVTMAYSDEESESIRSETWCCYDH